MGMDIYGLAPQLKSKKPTIDWSLNPSEEERKTYFEAKNTFEKENVGHYFRNNVWWWRPLWDYVYQLNDDILTEEDHEHGHFNDGHEITETQCEVICKRLTEALDNGEAEEYKNKFDAYVKSLDKDDMNSHYPFDLDNVRDFRNFVRECGGFQIC